MKLFAPTSYSLICINKNHFIIHLLAYLILFLLFPDESFLQFSLSLDLLIISIFGWFSCTAPGAFLHFSPLLEMQTQASLMRLAYYSEMVLHWRASNYLCPSTSIYSRICMEAQNIVLNLPQDLYLVIYLFFVIPQVVLTFFFFPITYIF